MFLINFPSNSKHKIKATLSSPEKAAYHSLKSGQMKFTGRSCKLAEKKIKELQK